MIHFVTVDVGGTKVLAAVMTEGGKILSRHKERTERRSKKKLIEQIIGAIDAAIQGAGIEKSQIAGIALGVPGVVEGGTGFVVITPNAPLTETPLGEILQTHFGVPVMVGNDANLGVLGESYRGAARDASSAFGIFVGTGIGGGLMIGGRLIEGFRGLGGEIGHFLIPLDADESPRSSKEKDKDAKIPTRHIFLEEICSRTAIENQLRQAILKDGQSSLLPEIVGDKKLERIRSGALKEALRRKDSLVSEVMRRASYQLGLATASVLHTVDPEVIIFGGGVIEACGDYMLPLIEKTARKVAMPGTGTPLKIVRSELGDDAILFGGASLLRNSGKVVLNPIAAAPMPDRLVTRGPIAQVDKPLEAGVE